MAPVVDAGGILGKLKEPVGLVRQAAFVRSLGDALPLNMVSGGLTNLAAVGSGIISEAGGSIISEAGGSVISNNGSSLHLLAATPDPNAIAPLERGGLVYVTKPEGIGAGVLSIFDAKGFDYKLGADNEARLVDRFHFVLTNFEPQADGHLNLDFDMKVLSSKRLPFVDKLVMRENVHQLATGGFDLDRLEYRLGFDVNQADNAVDRVELHLSGERADFVWSKNKDGQDIPGTQIPARMALAGTNGHGAFSGEARFPTGGNIELHTEHARDDGTKTQSDLTLKVDGSSTQVSTSRAGQLELESDRTVDGKVTLEVRDLAHGDPIVEPPEVATFDQGIATFDFGEAEKARARLY